MKTKITNVSEDDGKLELLHSAGRNGKLKVTTENNMMIPENIKHSGM